MEHRCRSADSHGESASVSEVQVGRVPLGDDQVSCGLTAPGLLSVQDLQEGFITAALLSLQYLFSIVTISIFRMTLLCSFNLWHGTG